MLFDLRSRVAGRRPNQPKLADKSFRNVSIITALNSQKDRINESGSACFAADTGQTLTDFYSVDTLGVEYDPVTSVVMARLGLLTARLQRLR